MRDIAIQKRENDLVVATFGRGFYILDDYRALRTVDEPTLAKDAVAFPVRNAWTYIPQTPLGFRGTGFQGETYYTAANPPFGAVFTYYMAQGSEDEEAAPPGFREGDRQVGRRRVLPVVGFTARRGA